DDPRRRALRQAHAAAIATPYLAPGAAPYAPPGAAVPGVVGAKASVSVSWMRGAPEDRLARVLEITRELANEHDVPRLLQRVTDHAVALLGAERGFVLLVGDEASWRRRRR